MSLQQRKTGGTCERKRCLRTYRDLPPSQPCREAHHVQCETGDFWMPYTRGTHSNKHNNMKVPRSYSWTRSSPKPMRQTFPQILPLRRFPNLPSIQICPPERHTLWSFCANYLAWTIMPMQARKRQRLSRPHLLAKYRPKLYSNSREGSHWNMGTI